jgi:hypothetical protein
VAVNAAAAAPEGAGAGAGGGSAPGAKNGGALASQSVVQSAPAFVASSMSRFSRSVTSGLEGSFERHDSKHRSTYAFSAGGHCEGDGDGAEAGAGAEADAAAAYGRAIAAVAAADPAMGGFFAKVTPLPCA